MFEDKTTKEQRLGIRKTKQVNWLTWSIILNVFLIVYTFGGLFQLLDKTGIKSEQEYYPDTIDWDEVYDANYEFEN